MSRLKLTLECTRSGLEKLSLLLEKFGADSISLPAVSTESLFARSSVTGGNICERTRITALLNEDTDLDVLLACLRNCVAPELINYHHIELLRDKDQFREYQQAHQPETFGDKLCICPNWCTPPDDIPHSLVLDPGLSFGTGGHDTTALCLDWLARNDLEGRLVIDYGCGSGVLALAALVLGARHVYAVDIDPQALETTQLNAKSNNMQSGITVAHPGNIQLPYADILLANVLLRPLQELAPVFAGLVVPGGNLVLSGLLEVQVEECMAAYQTWFDMLAPTYRREWALLQGERIEGH
jgi:ribosomal protein L11 methyltransferase